jgi:hypothetical protein
MKTPFLTSMILAATTLLAIPLPAQPDGPYTAAQGPSWDARAAVVAARSNPPLEGQPGPVLDKPLYGTEVRRHTQTLGDGSHLDNTASSLFYRDAQGRTRVENSDTALIYDPVAHATYRLNLKKKTFDKSPVDQNVRSYSIAVSSSLDGKNTTRTSWWATTGSETTASPSGSSNSSAAPRSGVVNEVLPPQFLNGVSVQGSRATVVVPAGKIGNDSELKVVTEHWFSDDLKVLIKSVTNHPIFGVTTYELTNIVQTPPDPALFQVPADYTETVIPRPVHK